MARNHFCEDDKVYKETCRCLDHTDLTIGHRNSRYHVSTQINTENGYGTKWEGYVSKDEKQERGDFGNIGGQSVGNGFLKIVKDKTTFFNTSNNGCKVIIQQDHVSGLFGYIRSSNTHSNTNISFLQGWGVIDTITSYGYNGTHSLTIFNNDKFLLG